ncbi:F510_1955 family glycosylhydrolase [Salinispora fenicalii]|uniref:F510_1955 family glycosylhydrolase n=1 Tax=Salinispora fenicalii TaxID=1137263 RepID=UPI00048331A3|nr:glycosyl hydrolase [Salinispora fenicalii]
MNGTPQPKRPGSRPGFGRKTQGRSALATPAWIIIIATLAVLAVLTAVVAFALRGPGSSNSDTTGTGHQEFGHVHGIAVDPGSGALHVATHVGLFRIGGPRTAVRVSRDDLDLMGFTVVGPGHFLASGHSTHGPANVGLIESTDGGVTWQEKSLSGTADFHGLQVAHGSVYGYNSADAAFMVSADQRDWEHRSRTAIGAFAVSPTDDGTVLAVGRDGLQRSTDGGRSWQLVPDAPAVGLLTWDNTGVWTVAPDGAVWSSSDGGGQWQRRGEVPGEPHSFAVQNSALFAALAGDRVVGSTDGGATWTDRYAPE